MCSTPLLAAGHWQKGVNSPAMKYTNHPACMNVKPALSLLQCLRSRPATSSHGSRPQWSQKTGQLKIKAVYPCIQTTEPKLGTGSSDISNIQCLQSSQIPPYSLLKKQLTLHVHNRGGGGKNPVNHNLYKSWKPKNATSRASLGLSLHNAAVSEVPPG